MKFQRNYVGSATVPTIFRRAQWPALHYERFILIKLAAVQAGGWAEPLNP
jgi:hypothetical protein